MTELKKEAQKSTALDNAIDILMTLGSQNSKSIRELGEELGIPKSSLHRILQTFENRGFVKQDEKTLKYSVGYAILELGTGLKASNELRNIAYSVMEKLRDETGETVQLAIQEKERIVILETIDGTKELRMFSQAGKTYPLTYGNFGKVFLSEKSQAEIVALMDKYPLEKYATNSIVDPAQYVKRVAEVKAVGTSLGIDDPIDGAYSIAAPIFNHRQEIVASIAIAGVKMAIDAENIGKMEKLVRESALALSNKIGYAGNR